MVTYPKPLQSEPIPQGREIQNGDTGNNKDPLQIGKWVTSIDFKDAYFHIPIQNQSRKYLRFHIQGQSYQFKALPFGLSTPPMEYLDDWLVRARFHQTRLQHTQTLVAIFVRS